MIKSELAIIIKLKRKAMGMTQEKLAEKMETSRTNVVKWETGSREPEWKNFVALCVALELTVEDFIEEVE